MAEQIQTPTDAAPGEVPLSNGRHRTARDVWPKGSFTVYEISREHPKGALLPIEGVPKFQTQREAEAWIRDESGDLLSGKQFLLFRAVGIGSMQIEHVPQLKVQWKPKHIREGDDGSDGDD